MAPRHHQLLAFHRQLLAFFVMLLCLISCEQSSPSLNAPRPGRNQKPQIYYLKERSQASTWWEPDPVMLQELLGARFDLKIVASKAETQDWLQKWNARPIDILILGPGLPQESWATLKLPINQHRIVLALGSSPASNWQNVFPNENEVQKFISALCTKAFVPAGCKLIFENQTLVSKNYLFKTGPNLISLGTRFLERTTEGAPLQLSIALRWDLFFEDLLKPDQKLYAQPTYHLGFGSAYLQTQASKALGNPPNETLNQFLENWNLKALSNTQSGSLK